ncbi:hypothetical protein [Bradyrhizobium sp. USDA 10063]
MMKINGRTICNAASDAAWELIDKAMRAGGTVEDVIKAVMAVHVSIAAERRFGSWCHRHRDVELTYLDCLALRLQEVDDGNLELARDVATAIGRAREACGERRGDRRGDSGPPARDRGPSRAEADARQHLVDDTSYLSASRREKAADSNTSVGAGRASI